MIITKIVSQKNNQDRVSVFIDGKYGVSLTLNDLLATKLKINQQIDEQTFKKLKKLSEDGKLKIRAIEWLMLRPRSAKELQIYLRQKKVDSDLAQTWTADFQLKKYQDDFSFAKWWTSQRRKANRSTRYISQELISKGVDSEIIKKVVQDDEISDFDTLRQLVAKKRKLSKYAVDEKKLVAYLLRQGYSYSLVKEVLAE